MSEATTIKVFPRANMLPPPIPKEERPTIPAGRGFFRRMLETLGVTRPDRCPMCNGPLKHGREPDFGK